MYQLFLVQLLISRACNIYGTKEMTAVEQKLFRRIILSISALTMRIVCTGVILYLCLVSSLAWPESPKPKGDNRELLARFLQFLAAPNRKCIDFVSYLNLYLKLNYYKHPMLTVIVLLHM